MIKKAWAVWKGGIKDGGGTISTETGVLDEAPYGFKSRFENGKGANPEELIGAAHAGCFSAPRYNASLFSQCIQNSRAPHASYSPAHSETSVGSPRIPPACPASVPSSPPGWRVATSQNCSGFFTASNATGIDMPPRSRPSTSFH